MTRTAIQAGGGGATTPATTPEARALQPNEILASTTVQGAVGAHPWATFAGGADLSKACDERHKRIAQVQGGDMTHVEAMLMSQALTLETIFTHLSRRAAAQEHLRHFAAHLGLALKAQAQCRATLEALAEVKHPRAVAFVKQANIASGHQQVNNAAAARGQGDGARRFSMGFRADTGPEPEAR